MDAYQQLKQLLLQPEQERLARLEAELAAVRKQLEDKERLLETLKPVISESIAEKIRESRDEMAEALAPVMGAAIKKQIAEARDEVVDALYPVIGQTIRKSIAEAMKKLVASINQRLDQAFSLRNLRMRLKARLTGVPYEELVLREALPFRIREIYVIHKTSGLVIARAGATDSTLKPDDIVISGMLTAIREFAREAFSTDQSRELNQITYDDLEIYLENSRHVYLAFVTEGVPPAHFTNEVHELETRIHKQFHAVFRDYAGEATPPAALVTTLQEFIRRFEPQATVAATPDDSRQWRKIAVLGGLGLAAIMWFGWGYPYWQDHRLKQTIQTLQQAGKLPNGSIQYQVNGGKIVVKGEVSTWQQRHQVLEQLQQQFQDVTVVDQLTIQPSPADLARIKAALIQQFPPEGRYHPQSLQLLVQDGLFILEGAVVDSLVGLQLAGHLAKITGAPVVVNATKVNRKALLKQLVETFRIYFDFSSSQLTPTARQQLAWLVHQLQQVPFKRLTVIGFADTLGTPEQNQRIARQRAEVVKNFLVQQGVPEKTIRVEVGAYTATRGQNPAEARRVEFRLE